MRIHARRCDYCGKSYEGRGETYCSSDCRNGAARGYGIVALFDVHHQAGVEPIPAYRAAEQFIRTVKPHVLCIGGDWWDFNCLSRHNKGKPLLIEKQRYFEDCQEGRKYLERLAPYTDRPVFLMGNHERRVESWVEENPVMEGFIDIRKDGGLFDLGFEVYKENELFSVGKVNLTHGVYTNEFHAKKHGLAFGDHIFYGHVHSNQTYMLFSRARRNPYVAMSIGCLCDQNPHWLRNKPNAWINQFLYIEVRGDGNFTPHPITIINGAFSFGGEVWKG